LYHPDSQKVKAGSGWYKDFMERNIDVIIRRHTYPNFVCMYETVYEDMVAYVASNMMEEEC
jgi:hypothetical protein